MKKLFKIAPWLGALVLGLTLLASCVYPPLGPEVYEPAPYYSAYRPGYRHAPGFWHSRAHWYRGHRGHRRWR
ncbi:MAG: hypothetical protein KJ621_18900 [Proteobacteria bacterium]|nr:hypothetical protein [Pseudomonadota bacterium]MBU1740891.1 hypothetical protein [Pseudomonadota bacterium]